MEKVKMADGKKYYCKVGAEFGRVMDDGTLVPKNPTGSTWLDLEYGEAVAFQTMVLRPMVGELLDDSLEMGIMKAVEQGDMDKDLGETLRTVINKGETKRK